MQNMAVGAREPFDEAPISSRSRIKGRHLQTGHPPFRTLFKHRDRSTLRVETHDIIQELSRLGRSKAKIGGPAVQPFVPALAGELQGAVGERTSSDQHMEFMRTMVE